MVTTGHNSAFEAIHTYDLGNPSILLNGRGNVTRFSKVEAKLPVPQPYTIVFEKETKPRPKRYLLRLINTSFETTFVFSIDNHVLTIIGADFVPIHSYSNTSVLVGIGQRYHVVVEANPIAAGNQQVPLDGNFWIRTYIADCGGSFISRPDPGSYEKTGILRYDSSSTAEPSSEPWKDISMACSDETYSSLKPVVEWQVGVPANGHTGEEHDVMVAPEERPYPLAGFALNPPLSVSTPLRIDYGDPTFLHLNNTRRWSSNWVIVPEDFKKDDWVSSSPAHSIYPTDMRRTRMAKIGR